MRPLFKLARSVRCGIQGMIYVLRTEQNMRIHLLAMCVVVAAGWYFGISLLEWIAVVLCIGVVMSLECVNTAIERIGDQVTQDVTPLMRHAKDAAAAGVLIASGMAAVVGVLIFAPHLWRLLA